MAKSFTAARIIESILILIFLSGCATGEYATDFSSWASDDVFDYGYRRGWEDALHRAEGNDCESAGRDAFFGPDTIPSE